MGRGPLDVVEELQQSNERIGETIPPTIPLIRKGGRWGRSGWEKKESTSPVAMGLHVHRFDRKPCGRKKNEQSEGEREREREREEGLEFGQRDFYLMKLFKL